MGTGLQEGRRLALDTWKRRRGCALCGRRTGQLGFYYRDPATKVARVSEMLGEPLDAVLAEIAKCVVLCWNCAGPGWRWMLGIRIPRRRLLPAPAGEG
jgi:hypothetical protein